MVRSASGVQNCVFAMICVATLACAPIVSSAAGFDCNRATTLVEKLICADQGLSQLDESLSKTYRRVRLSAPDPENSKLEQAQWLREVRDLCTDGKCLEREYRNRLAALEKLRSRGNTVLVVEHDEETMRHADYVIDLGPGAGVHGGEVVAAGTLAELMRHPDSITGQCLRAHKTYPSRGRRRRGCG